MARRGPRASGTVTPRRTALLWGRGGWSLVCLLPAAAGGAALPPPAPTQTPAAPTPPGCGHSTARAGVGHGPRRIRWCVQGPNGGELNNEHFKLILNSSLSHEYIPKLRFILFASDLISTCVRAPLLPTRILRSGDAARNPALLFPLFPSGISCLWLLHLSAVKTPGRTDVPALPRRRLRGNLPRLSGEVSMRYRHLCPRRWHPEHLSLQRPLGAVTKSPLDPAPVRLRGLERSNGGVFSKPQITFTFLF